MKKSTMRSALAIVSAAAAVLGTVPAFADEAKTYSVGIVKYVDDASLNQIESAILAELEKKGEELGVTFECETYDGGADATVLNQFASELIGNEVDAIIPIATPTAVIMQSATEDTGTPVIFSAVSDPETAGLVASNDAPGANLTGTSDALNTEAIFELIKAANPDIKKLGLLYSTNEDSSKKPIEAMKALCEENGIEAVEKTGTNNEEVIQAAQALIGEGVEAVFTPTDNTIMTAELAIYESFIEAGIPHYAGADSFALNGAFCGYGVNYVDLGTATADMTADILVNGTDPATTPVQTLDNGIATVNTETAEALGIDYSSFKDLDVVEDVVETKTAQNFTDLETEG